MDREAVKNIVQETMEGDIEVLHNRIDKVQKNMREMQRIIRILVRRNGLTDEVEA